MSEEPRETTSRFRWIALAIFAIAFGVRLLHLFQIRGAPFFTLLMGDARSYDAWARRIAAGDWLGTEVFYQAPLYPYFLAVVYRILGRDVMVVRMVQAVIGSLSCVLLADAARRLFDRTTGIVAGVLLALWAPAMFFDGLLQKSVLDVFFVCVVIWLVVRLKADTTKTRSIRSVRVQADRRWLWIGLALGCLALTRENALVFIVVLLAWALAGERRWRNAAWLAAGVAIVLVPVAARNSYVGGGFYVTTSQFGPNLYIGNNAHADGTYASLRYGRGAPEYERQDATELAERARRRQLTPGEVSSYWTDRALAFVTSQPLQWLELMARKFALVWNATEVVDTESQETYAEWSRPLRILGPIAHFGVLVPLAVLGAVLAWPLRPPLTILATLALAYAASVVLFYVFARYRYPLVPFLIVFAAHGLLVTKSLTFRERGAHRQSVTSWSRARRRVLSGSALVMATAVFANWPLVSRDWMRAVTESNIGVALQDDRRYEEAIEHYRRAVALRPDYAPALNNLATAERAAGRVDEAIATYRRALAVQADFPDAEYNLANALMDKGAADEAIDRFETALKSIPDSADAHNNLGTALAAMGRAEDAITEFRRALESDPGSATAHRNLGNLLAARGEHAAALDHLRRAVAADPSSGDAHYDLGTLLLETGASREAAHEFRAALERMPASAEAHNNFGIALASDGRLEDAIDQFREALKLEPGFADADKNLRLALGERERRTRR